MSITRDSVRRAPPERLEVRTCFGCGAMGVLGECDDDCREQPVELIRAAAFDEVAAVHSSACECIEAFRGVAEELAWHMPSASPDDYELSYRSVQANALAVLHRFRRSALEDVVLEGAAEPVTATWCADCETVESFQPCMEVCIWRPVEWVSASSYRREREQALSEMAVEDRLRQLLSRVAWVTPLDGHWRACWRALQVDARRALDV